MTEEEKKKISEEIAHVREKLAAASDGRDVDLLLATKTVPPEKIAYAVRECGVTLIGENRVNELLEKYEQIKDLPCGLHFIGTLQTNKVKYIIDKVKLIHSVDSEKLLYEINRQAEKHDLTMDVLIEINIGREENKGGILPEDLPEFIDKALSYPRVRVRGLMTIAPKCEEKDEYRKFFTQTYQMSLDILQKKLHNIDSPVLSMGMSNSYEIAAACGATLVRVGSAVFGARTYPT